MTNEKSKHINHPPLFINSAGRNLTSRNSLSNSPFKRRNLSQESHSILGILDRIDEGKFESSKQNQEYREEIKGKTFGLT
jgi:hypothetical protein